MNIQVKNLLISTWSLKIYAFVTACFLWYFLSFDNRIIIKVTVPVCFADDMQVECPESICVTLRAKRTTLYTYDFSSLAFCIANQDLPAQKNYVPVSAEKLLLSSDIEIIACNPAYVTVIKHDCIGK